MLAARVIGYATATVKHPSMAGWKLLVVSRWRRRPLARRDPVLAVDSLAVRGIWY